MKCLRPSINSIPDCWLPTCHGAGLPLNMSSTCACVCLGCAIKWYANSEGNHSLQLQPMRCLGTWRMFVLQAIPPESYLGTALLKSSHTQRKAVTHLVICHRQLFKFDLASCRSVEPCTYVILHLSDFGTDSMFDSMSAAPPQRRVMAWRIISSWQVWADDLLHQLCDCILPTASIRVCVCVCVCVHFQICKHTGANSHNFPVPCLDLPEHLQGCQLF